MATIRICTLILLLLSLISCSPKDKNVRQHANAYLEARAKGDFARAALYTTAASLPRLDELAVLAVESDVPGQRVLGIAIETLQFARDTAILTYVLESYGSDQLKLLLEENVWKVYLSAQDIPDAFILAHDLLQLEARDTISHLQRSLDAIIMQDDSLPILEELSDDFPE